MDDRLYIIDGTAFAFRSYYAIKSGLSDSKGRPTNAAYGFTRILLKLLREKNPSHIAVVFDVGGKTFRHDLYAEYKANRKDTPTDLVEQFPIMKQIVQALNIPLILIPQVEADDVIGTLARRAEEEGQGVVVVTGDKDLLQLVSDHIMVYDPSKGGSEVWYGPAEVREKFGVGPEGVIDTLALMGIRLIMCPALRGLAKRPPGNCWRRMVR